jgi:hypothetical protein
MLAGIEDPVVRQLLTFWDQSRGARSMPAKADIDPLQLGSKLLPHIMLIDLVENGTRLRYRLCGTAVAEAAGTDLAGKHVDELNANPAYTRYIDGLYRRCIEAKRPIYSESGYVAHSSTVRRTTRRLICPLSDDGATIVHFISAQTFHHSGLGLAPTVHCRGWIRDRADHRALSCAIPLASASCNSQMSPE